jgi:hypothetical protein
MPATISYAEDDKRRFRHTAAWRLSGNADDRFHRLATLAARHRFGERLACESVTREGRFEHAKAGLPTGGPR